MSFKASVLCETPSHRFAMPAPFQGAIEQSLILLKYANKLKVTALCQHKVVYNILRMHEHRVLRKSCERKVEINRLQYHVMKKTNVLFSHERGGGADRRRRGLT